MNRLSNRHIHGPVYAKPVKADGTKVTVKSHNVSTSEMKNGMKTYNANKF